MPQAFICIKKAQLFDCIISIFHNVLIHLLSLACRGDFQTRKAFDTVCIMAKIFHVCIMVQTAWKARLGDTFSLNYTCVANWGRF